MKQGLRNRCFEEYVIRFVTRMQNIGWESLQSGGQEHSLRSVYRFGDAKAHLRVWLERMYSASGHIQRL